MPRKKKENKKELYADKRKIQLIKLDVLIDQRKKLNEQIKNHKDEMKGWDNYLIREIE